MKKINFYLGAFAVASTALLSSCFSSDGEADVPEPPVVEIVPEVVLCEITPSANVEDVTFKGPVSATKDQTITITATANEPGKYTSDKLEKTITIGDEHEIEVKFEFTLKPVAVEVEHLFEDETVESITVFQGKSEEGEASKTTTDENEKAADVELIEDTKVEEIAMVIPKAAVADAKETASSTAFSVVVVPANDTIKQVPVSEIENVAEETSNEEPAEIATLQAVCEPSGAVFSEPVTITIGAPESAGLDFCAINGNDTVPGSATSSTLSISVPHFSAWDYVLRANVDNVQNKQTSETKTVTVSEGNNTIKYTSTLGWTVHKKNVLVNAYLVGKLGSSKKVTTNKSVVFQSTGEGRVTYRVYTKTTEFDVVSGDATFHVVADAGSEIEIVGVEYNGHSGGGIK